MAIGSSSRGGAKTRLVAVHTAEGARTARDLRAYFDKPGVNASSHVAIDADTTLDMVPRERASWTLRNGNPVSVNAELCGFARWTREQWLSTGAVDGCRSPKAILDRTAEWIRRECEALGIPKRKLSAADVAAGKSGVIGHVEWTVGMRDGTHWDPGPGFPWDYVMSRVTGGGGGAPAKPDPARSHQQRHHEEISMRLEAGKHEAVDRIPAGAKRVYITPASGKMAARIQWFGAKYPKTSGRYPKDGLLDADWVAKDDVQMSIDRMRSWGVDIPKGAVGFRLQWTYSPDSEDRQGSYGRLNYEF